MAFLLSVLFMSAEESDPFADLKAIADKIIPDDPWAIIIQLVSTFILVFILAKFLVKPARKFIAARQEYIQTNLEEASSKNQEADIKLARRSLNGERHSPATRALWFYNSPGDCSAQWWGQWNSGRYKSHCFYAPVESENCYK